MEITKATYSNDGKELWITIRASDGEFMNLHVNSSLKLEWEKNGVVLNLKEK